MKTNVTLGTLLLAIFETSIQNKQSYSTPKEKKNENLLFKPVSLGAVCDTAIDNGNDRLHSVSVMANEPEV